MKNIECNIVECFGDMFDGSVRLSGTKLQPDSYCVIAADERFQSFVGMTDEEFLNTSLVDLQCSHTVFVDLYNLLIMIDDGTEKQCGNYQAGENTYKHLQIGDGDNSVFCIFIKRSISSVKSIIDDSPDIFNTIINMITMPVFCKDAGGVYTLCNKAFSEFIGKSSEELIGSTVCEVASPELAEQYCTADDLLLSGKTKENYQVYDSLVQYADGSFHDVTFNKSLLISAQGEILGLIGIIFDITERKMNERKLLEMKEELERLVAWRSALFESNMVAVVAVNEDRIICECNQTFRHIFGYADKDELIGKRADVIYVNNAESARFASIAYGKINKNSFVKLEAEFCRKNGHKFWAVISGSAIDNNDLSKGFIWVIVDIDEMKKKEAELARINKLFESSLEQNPIPFVLVSAPENNIQLANTAALNFIDIDKSEYRFDWLDALKRKGIRICYDDGTEVPICEFPMVRALSGQSVQGQEIMYQFADGERKWAIVNSGPVYGNEGDIIAGIVTMIDITERKRLDAILEDVNGQILEVNKMLNEKAVSDSLTNVYNHQYIIESLNECIEYSARYSEDLSILMIDIDYFKIVNDKHGHQVGDEVLVEMAQTIHHALRGSDSLGRYGGEEFLIILRRTDLRQAVIVAEKIRTIIADKSFTSKGLKITLSIGVAECSDSNAASLISVADDNLYRAKRNGRNRVEA